MANKLMKRDQFIWEMNIKTIVKSTRSPDWQKFKSPHSECWQKVQNPSYIAHESIKSVKSL